VKIKIQAPAGTCTTDHPARSPTLYYWAISAPTPSRSVINQYGASVGLWFAGEMKVPRESPIPVSLSLSATNPHGFYCNWSRASRLRSRNVTVWVRTRPNKTIFRPLWSDLSYPSWTRYLGYIS